MNRRPLGFLLLGFCAGAFGTVLLAGVATEALGDGPAHLLAAFAFVTAEALVCGRPWAFRASVALAAAFWCCLLAGGPAGIGLIIASSAFIGPALAYVYTSTHAPFRSAVLGHPRRRRWGP